MSRAERTERWLQAARCKILEQFDALVHSLDCGRCGLRQEALAVLLLVGWSEDAFYEAVLDTFYDE